MNPFHHFFHAHFRHRGHHFGHRFGHHLGRHGHPGRDDGHGHGEGFPGGPGPGFGGFERGRKLGSNDLQLLILALLARQASHGYELIKEIDQRSRGYYVPSPGMIYPALSYLDEVGYASVELEGSKKRYQITVAGLAHLDEHRGAVDAMWEQLSRFGERMERLRSEEGADDRGADLRDGRGRRGRRGDELHAAFETLAIALRERHRAEPEERRRVAAILAEAAAAIRGGKPAGDA